ncbi:MAG: hypothetical protein GY859_42850, partial [Desulfobacterales bacterium]|nr:hypothetical protein [Desulfobacterales bacterium]
MLIRKSVCLLFALSLILGIFTTGCPADGFDYTIYDVIAIPTLNDGLNLNGWTRESENFFYTDGSNNKAKASWIFSGCKKDGEYRILIHIPKSSNHTTGSAVYEIYKNAALVKSCNLDQNRYFGYVSLGDVADGDDLFSLKKGDAVEIVLITDRQNIGVDFAKLFYIQDFDLGIDSYSQKDSYWGCKNLSGADKESDAKCTGKENGVSCCNDNKKCPPVKGRGPMYCWGCTTCAFTSALSYYGVDKIEILKKNENINPRRVAAAIDKGKGYSSGHFMSWENAKKAMESIENRVEIILKSKEPESYSNAYGKNQKYILEENLKKGRPVIVETLYRGENRNSKHWVLLKGVIIQPDGSITYRICDSYFPRDRLSEYDNFISRYILTRGVDNQASWFFNKDSFEGWKIENCANRKITLRGWLEITPSSNSRLVSPNLAIKASDVDYIQFFCRNDTGSAAGRIHIWTDVGKGFHKEIADFNMSFINPSGKGWNLIQINVHEIEGWDAAREIRGVRIDPVESGDGENDRVFIDYITFRKQENNQSGENVQRHPEGALIAVSPHDPSPGSIQGVYLVEDGRKRRVPDMGVLRASNLDIGNLITVKNAELECYDPGDDVTEGSKTVIHKNGEATLYLETERNRARGFIGEKVYFDMGFNFEEVTHVDKIKQDTYPLITTIYPEGALIRYMDGPAYYLVSGGRLSRVDNLSTLRTLGYSLQDKDGDGLWDRVIQVKAKEYGDHGDLIEAAALSDRVERYDIETGLKWPVGGETLMGGVKRWIKYFISAPERIKKVVIRFTTNGFDTFINLTDRAPKHSSFMWEVPNVDTDKASVQVTAYDKFGRAYSAAPKQFLSIRTGSPGSRDFFTIFNDGGEEMTVSGLYVENGSSWIKSMTVQLPEPYIIDCGRVDCGRETGIDPFVIGANGSARVDIEIERAGLSYGEYNGVIHVVSNDPDAPDAPVEIQLNIKSDQDAPAAPIALTASPSGWT